MHETENVTEKTFDFCEALCRISISRYIGRTVLAAVLACKPSKCWHYHDTSCQQSKRRPRPGLQNYNAEIMVGFKMIMHNNIYCLPPPVTEPFIGKGWARAEPSHNSMLTQQNQAQNVFIVIHTPPLTRLFVM